MNKLLALCGLAMLGIISTPQEKKSISKYNSQEVTLSRCQIEENNPTILLLATEEVWVTPRLVSKIRPTTSKELNLNDIPYIEDEAEIDLGFDTADYLPSNFDPYKVYFDLNTVNYIEEAVFVPLDFNTADYLPENFNPYANFPGIAGISYMEVESPLDLGFDTKMYLPEGFDPYEVYFDLNSVEYIEEEAEVEFNFNTEDYLPMGFDPYSR